MAQPSGKTQKISSRKKAINFADQGKKAEKKYRILGDVYNELQQQASAAEWAIDEISEKNLPYLQNVKLWSNTWPHLRFLSHFMEISTIPDRWLQLQDLPEKKRISAREERWRKCNVTRIEYHHESGRPVETTSFKEAQALKEGLQKVHDPDVAMVVYAVEDLSRDVIDALGSKFDVDPSFFGAHIQDFAWYNTRDRYRTNFDLDIDNLQRNWLSLRYISARYFRTRADFKKAEEEAAGYNIMRRPDDDEQNKSVFDEQEAVTTLSRSRLGLWLSPKPEDQEHGHATVIVLLDPTISAGYPLWMDSGTFTSTAGLKANRVHKIPPRIVPQSTMEEFVFWSKQRAVLLDTDGNGIPDQPLENLPLEIIIRIICARWQVIIDYANTRLNQIEWEIQNPEDFARVKNDGDSAINRLHLWRRVIPLYNKMLKSTIDRFFEAPCVLHWLNSADVIDHKTPLYARPQFSKNRIEAFKTDMERLHNELDGYQERIDRLSSVVQSIISINDSRQGLTDSRNVGRLTWLATFFIPLSLVASMFSMQADITSSRETFGWFFAAGIPLSIILLGVTFLTTKPSVQNWCQEQWDRLKGSSQSGQ